MAGKEGKPDHQALSLKEADREFLNRYIEAKVKGSTPRRLLDEVRDIVILHGGNDTDLRTFTERALHAFPPDIRDVLQRQLAYEAEHPPVPEDVARQQMKPGDVDLREIKVILNIGQVNLSSGPGVARAEVEDYAQRIHMRPTQLEEQILPALGLQGVEFTPLTDMPPPATVTGSAGITLPPKRPPALDI